MSKDAPDPPDYRGAAEEQAESSREVTNIQTWANRPNQFTPWGTTTWDTNPYIDPGTGDRVTQWNQTTTLDPTLQEALDDQQAITRGRSDIALSLLGRSRDEFGEQVSFDDFIGLGEAPQAQSYGQNLPGYGQFDTSGLPGYSTTPQVGQYGQEYLPNRGSVPGAENLQRGLDYSGAYSVGDPNQIRGRAEDAIYDRQTSRLDPMWDRRESQLATQLRNQGLNPGDEAYNEQMAEMSRQRNDAYSSAMNDAIMGGGAESDRMFGQQMQRRGQDIGEINQQGQFGNNAALSAYGMNMQGAQMTDAQRQAAMGEMLGFGGQRYDEQMGLAGLEAQRRSQGFGEMASGAQFQNDLRGQMLTDQLRGGNQEFNQQMQQANYQNTLRQQQIAEIMQQRGFSLNEINAILSGQQVGMPSMPSFQNAQRSEATQYSQAARDGYSAELDSFNAEQQALQGMMQGASGLAMMSDVRLKDNITFHHKGNRFCFYTWDWNVLARKMGVAWMPTYGVIAQQVVQIHPDAVIRTDTGMLAVDYERIYEIEEILA